MKVMNDFGPGAPRDPDKDRSCIYVMWDQMIQSVKRANGAYTTEIYLDDMRLINKAEVIGGVKDKKILEMLNDSRQFQKLVHSIGVTIEDANGADEITFSILNYGKVNPYQGTKLSMKCKADGAERRLVIDNADVSRDNVVGQFVFDFGVYCMAKVTVRLFLNNGFNVPPIEKEEPVVWQGMAYQKMLHNSMVQLGNTCRLKCAIKKARSGEDVTIAFIGGSITQGAGSVPINTECYAYKTYEYFKNQYCKDPEKCHYIKAGIGGTSSELGLVRYEQDVTQFGRVKPDIVVVEFAVNDSGDETDGVCHESLIYHILEADQRPAVIMLFSVFANDWNLQERLEPIGKTYGLPMVSLMDALTAQFKQSKENGQVISKRQYFYDIFHPTNAGHRVMSECLCYLLDKADQANDEQEINLAVPPAIGRDYKDTHLYDRVSCANTEAISIISEGSFTKTDKELQCVERNRELEITPQFINNWMHDGTSTEQPFVMKVMAKTLFVVIKDSGDLRFGAAEFYVDGALVRTYDPKEVGWTHCNAVLIMDQKEKAEHTITIKMADGQSDKRFTILAVAIIE